MLIVIAWCSIASAVMGFVNFACLTIINDKLSEIKTELLKFKKEKEGEQ